MEEKMIELLYYAQNNDEELHFGVYGKGVNVAIQMVPDVMEVNGWYSITDKERGSDILIAFSVDSDIEYDEYDYIFSFKSGELTVEIGE